MFWKNAVRQFLFVFLMVPIWAVGSESVYRIEPVAGNVYRFTAGSHHAVFMVTSEGILITDPISPEAAKWLKGELQTRFDVPVRYMIYSHNHFDHAFGGEVFDSPSVTVISHALARSDLERTLAPTRLPDLTFKDEMTVHLGGDAVHLRYHGVNNGRGSISMKFESADVMFVVDWIVIGRMPYRDLKGYDIHGMIDSTREVLEEDFSTFVGGHAEIGTKADVARYLDYIETLYARVVEGRRAGKSLETLQAEIRLEEFSDLANYEEWLPLNIAGVWRILDDVSYFDLQEMGP